MESNNKTMSLKSILERAQVWDASFDELDNFRDLNHLIHIIIDRTNKIIPGCECHFFIHNEAKKDYREEIKDDIITIDERNIIIVYLSLKNEILYKESIEKEKLLKDNELTEFILFKKLGLDFILPFVHSFKLLGFLGISFKDKSKKKLTQKEEKELYKLKDESLLNINAALLVDRRFAELMVLADLGKEISAKSEADDICNFVFESIYKVVDYSGGILYLVDKNGILLKPKATYNINDENIPKNLAMGESITGIVAKGGKPLLIKNLYTNDYFKDKNKENYLNGSIISIPLKTKNTLVGVLTIFNNKEQAQFTGENLHLISIFANFASTAIENLRLYEELEKSYFDTVSALVGALDANDPYTRGHSDRVMKYSEEIAKNLNISKEDIKMIKFGALLHDIGKIGISGDIIKKPSKLTEEEYKIIMEHPKIGGKILKDIEFLKHAKNLVMYHHERLDGNGYPFKLKEEEIPLGVRILLVSDVFDALTSDRPYRKALSAEKAFKIIIKDIGTHFDINVIKAFIKYLKKINSLPKNFKLPEKYDNLKLKKPEQIL